jgi:hypothetical protein
MSTRPPLTPETLALLERERAIQPLPAAQRARAMARARAALAAGGAGAAAPASRHSRSRWAVAAAAALIASAAVGAAAYEIRARLARAPQATPAPRATPVAPVVPAARAVAVAVDAPAVVPEPPVAAPPLSASEAARAELHLLREARGAVARGDFSGALAPIAEHTRRFKNGRLAEEREALRVKSLAGLGRTEDARRAAAAFRVRFPRSVLLPAVSQMSPSTP